MTHESFDHTVNRLGANFVIAGYMAFATLIIALPPQTIGSNPLAIWSFQYVKFAIGCILLFAGVVSILTKCGYIWWTIANITEGELNEKAEKDAATVLALERNLKPWEATDDNKEYWEAFYEVKGEIQDKLESKYRLFSNAVCALVVMFYLSCWGLAVIVFLTFDVIPKLIQFL